MKLTKAYKVVMSNAQTVRIDQDELDKVVDGINRGATIIVRRGIINPSYYVAVGLDTDRMDEWSKECDYSGEQGRRARARGLEPLRSIFEGTQLHAALESAQAARTKLRAMPAPSLPYKEPIGD